MHGLHLSTPHHKQSDITMAPTPSHTTSTNGTDYNAFLGLSLPKSSTIETNIPDNLTILAANGSQLQYRFNRSASSQAQQLKGGGTEDCHYAIKENTLGSGSQFNMSALTPNEVQQLTNGSGTEACGGRGGHGAVSSISSSDGSGGSPLQKSGAGSSLGGKAKVVISVGCLVHMLFLLIFDCFEV